MTIAWAAVATQTITRQRAPLGAANPARYNAQERDWSDPDELDISQCSVQPQPVAEVVDGSGRDAVPSRWLVIAPPGADVLAADRIAWAGDTYDVDGQPLVFTTGILDHVEFFMIRTEG
jgi:hypothetical protein